MLRQQAFKFELMPNGEQTRKMRQFAGCRRFVYNKAFALNQARYTAKEKRLNWAALDKLLPQWKREHEFLADAPSQALQHALKDLERAYERFFADVKKGYRIAPSDKKLRRALRKQGVSMAYPPAFKKKGKDESFRFPQGFKSDNANGRFLLPKLGWMRYRKSREVLGEVCNVTISQKCGKWFASIQTEREVEIPKHPSTSDVAIDMGVAVFATLSTAETFGMPDTARLEERKKFLQRRLKNKKKFSSNWKKLHIRIRKLDRRVTDIRNNCRHQFTNAVTKKHSVVYGDDLAIKNMSKSAKGTAEEPGKNVKAKSGLNRVLLAQGIYEVDRQFEYKSLWRGGTYIPCPPAFGSQRCPCCGHIAKENRKSQALFECVDCGFTRNADFVATLNKLEAGRAFVACGEFPSWTRFGALGTNSVKQEPTEATQATSV